MAAALTLTACAAMPMASFAVDDPPTYDVTINDNGNVVAKTHSFSAYQLIAGTPNEASSANTLTGTSDAFTWGSALNTATKQSAFINAVQNAFNTDTSKTKVAALTASSTPYQVAEALSELTAASDAAKLAKAIGTFVGTSANAISATQTYDGSGNTAKISGLNGGYYFIEDTTNIAATSNDAKSKFILNVVSDQTVTIKTDAPTLDKKIWHNDGNASPNTADNTAPTFNSGKANGWADVGDNQIGDTVYYCIKTYIPDMSDYDTYKYKINDTFSTGLTYDSTAGVTKIEVFDKSDNYLCDITAENSDSDSTGATKNAKPNVSFESGELTVDFVDLKECLKNQTYTSGKSVSDTTGGYIYTYYQATLNKDALVSGGVNGQQNNPNTANLTYSNNPNQSGSGDNSTSNTPDDTVYDWTYTYEIDKVDENNEPLKGATFSVSLDNNKLYFVQLTGEDLTAALGKVKTADNTALSAAADTLYYRIAKSTDTGATQTIGSASDDTHTKYYLIGLDDTKAYSIKEESAPANYAKKTTADNVTISNDYNDAGSALTKLNNQTTGGLGVQTVVNYKNSALPATGGIGTTLFILGGGCAAGIAGIYLISKKKTREEE